MKKSILACFLMLLFLSGVAFAEFEFNQRGDNQTDSLGYYYGITGGLFPTGATPNGDNATGGTFRYLLDDPDWGAYPLNQWNKDDWFPENAGLALTLKYGDTVIYDNNGIEDGSGAGLYDYSNSPNYFPLLYRGYCMVNNFDWIYATYFKLENETTFDTIIGYFDPTAATDQNDPSITYQFDPNSPSIGYHMSIWTAYKDMPETSPESWLPTVPSFTGDAFDSLLYHGTFSVSETGVNRVFPSGMQRAPDPIWRLVYKLDWPITLPAGVYFFSHNAVVLKEVIFGQCSTGIMLFPSEALSLSDSLEGCAAGVKNHGQYVKCVSKVTGNAVSEGIITGAEKGTIQSCAAQSSVGKK
ncbi:hypothetical protein [Desulfoferrobacter suflitae]|uniref:hypothetical protein n=1 Tax=Desulfoferrobacter suflitae TaxID=2865782 RepID=UPI002164DEE1|nr:hypothetical protein [Desulfoferrobacter suflitae]MCK8602622.1 hypothetical protein [Desulfoferrobacter suflitae]